MDANHRRKHRVSFFMHSPCLVKVLHSERHRTLGRLCVLSCQILDSRTTHLPPRVLRKHHRARWKHSARAVRDLDVHPFVEAHDKLPRGSAMEIEVVVPRSFPELETCTETAAAELKCQTS